MPILNPFKNIIFRPVFIVFISSIMYSQNVIVKGVIRNPADKPVKKANVTLRNLKDEIMFEDFTNRKGEFEFEDVEPKFYYLVVEHEGDGLKRIKINPRKNKNENLDLIISLQGIDNKVECYLFGNDPPTSFDPILNIRNLNIETRPEHITISWKDIIQARLYTLYENGKKIYVGEDTRFEKDVYPGIEYCYAIQVSGDYGLQGELSQEFCGNAPTQNPRDIIIDPLKNSLKLSWNPVEGAVSYKIFRDNEEIKITNATTFIDSNLQFDNEYYYKISAIDGMKKQSAFSVEVKGKTHELVDVPILSSMNSKTNIVLIWNEVNEAITYNVYRDSDFIASVDMTTFTDPMPPGKEYCYSVTCIDKYDVETEKSKEHCTKVALSPPKGLQADADVSSMHLNWEEVPGADYYMVYEYFKKDSVNFIGEARSTQFTVKPLDFSADVCFVVTSIDLDGQESDFSESACNVVYDPPSFNIQGVTVNDPSGNGLIDAREKGNIQIAIFNDGQSPAHNIIVTILPKNPEVYMVVGEPFVIDTLDAGRIKYANINVEGMLQLESGEHDFEVFLSSRENVELSIPYEFKIESKSMVPPRMIVADFAISNDFGTQYIPKDEKVRLIVRIQNVGEGETESVLVNVIENRTYTTPDFSGEITFPAFNPGDYMDIEIPIKSSETNFAIEVELTDYLGKKSVQRIDLETMKNYRSPMELTVQDIGAADIVYYPDEFGEVDVDRRIPLGRKNPNALAVIIGTQEYEDKNYPYLEYADRDRDVMRTYFRQAFGLSDFQILPSKPWQMEGGPSFDEYQMIFDPYQGDLRRRIISAEKYSEMDEIHLYVYFRGYGEWINGRPFLIPRDAVYDRDVTKFSLDEMVGSLSRLSVLSIIEKITLFMDVTYVNPEESSGLLWDYPDLPEKISILSSNSNGETSQSFNDKKHSFFTYSLLKGLSGNADDGDNIIDLGEITEYVYKSVPENIRNQPGSLRQNPKFNGLDLKRILLDLR